MSLSKQGHYTGTPDAGTGHTRQIPALLRCWGLWQSSLVPADPSLCKAPGRSNWGRGGGDETGTSHANILTIQRRNDIHQTRGKDYLIKISLLMWSVLRKILGLNEWVQRKKDEDGWLGRLHRRDGGRTWVLEVRWGFGKTENPFQTRGEKHGGGELTSLQAKEGSDIGQVTGRPGRVKFPPGKRFRWMVFEGGRGEGYWNGALSAGNVTMWREWTRVSRDYRPGDQSLGCYCSHPSVKQKASMNPSYRGCLIRCLPLQFKKHGLFYA